MAPATRIQSSESVVALASPSSSVPTSSSVPPASSVSAATTPLLTRFTPASGCTSTWWDVWPQSSPSRSIITAAVGQQHEACDLPSILPGKNGTGIPILYSPGACRAEYRPVSTITIGVFGDATTSLCCKDGLTLLSTGSWTGNCGNLVTSHSMTIHQEIRGTTTSTIVDSFFAVDMPYTVAWASSELPLFTPSGLPLIIANDSRREAAASSSSYGPSVVRGVPTIPSTSAPASSSANLSTGAQAGIGVAAAAVGIAIGALLMWFCFVHKRYRKFAELEGGEVKEKEGNVLDGHPKFPELGDESAAVEAAVEERSGEMLGDVGHELPQDLAAHEIDAGMRHELDGNYRGEELTDIATPIDDSPPTVIK